jgi:hypothetical protein
MRRRYTCYHVMYKKDQWWDGKEWGTYEALHAKPITCGKEDYRVLSNSRTFRTLKRAIKVFKGTSSPCELYIHYYKSGLSGKGWICKYEGIK